MICSKQRLDLKDKFALFHLSRQKKVDFTVSYAVEKCLLHSVTKFNGAANSMNMVTVKKKKKRGGAKIKNTRIEVRLASLVEPAVKSMSADVSLMDGYES